MQYYTIPRNTVQPETPQKQSLDTQVVRENENVTLGCDATGYPKVGFQWIYSYLYLILSYLILSYLSKAPYCLEERGWRGYCDRWEKGEKKYLKIRRELLFVCRWTLLRERSWRWRRYRGSTWAIISASQGEELFQFRVFLNCCLIFFYSATGSHPLQATDSLWRCNVSGKNICFEFPTEYIFNSSPTHVLDTKPAGGSL